MNKTENSFRLIGCACNWQILQKYEKTLKTACPKVSLSKGSLLSESSKRLKKKIPNHSP